MTSNQADSDSNIGDVNSFSSNERKQKLEQFLAFLRRLLMHAGVCTALGGVMTMVGEPQNLIIAKSAGWGFIDFFLRMAPVTLPVLACGLLVCLLVKRFNLFSYGTPLPEPLREVLKAFDRNASAGRSKQEQLKLVLQALIGVWLVLALAFHLAEVGLIGLLVIILTTSLS